MNFVLWVCGPMNYRLMNFWFCRTDEFTGFGHKVLILWAKIIDFAGLETHSAIGPLAHQSTSQHERDGENVGRSGDLRRNHPCANSVKLRRCADGVDDDED